MESKIEKVSRIKTIKANGTYDSQHGLMYKYEYTFDNDQILNAQHKSKDPFKEGDGVQYVVKGNNETYGDYGTVSKVNEYVAHLPQGKGGTQNASFALSYAKDWCLGLNNDGNPQTEDNVIAVADKFNDWLKQN